MGCGSLAVNNEHLGVENVSYLKGLHIDCRRRNFFRRLPCLKGRESCLWAGCLFYELGVLFVGWVSCLWIGCSVCGWGVSFVGRLPCLLIGSFVCE